MTKEDWQEFNQEVIKPAKRSIKKNWKKWLGIGYLHFKTVYWMGYCTLAFIFYGFVAISGFVTYSTWYAWDLVLLIVNFFLLHGVAFYVSKPKPILSHKFFRLLFWTNIFIFGNEILAFIPGINLHLPSSAFFQTSNIPPFTSLNEVLSNTIWYLPALYATFRLGFMKEWPKQKDNPQWARFYSKPRRVVYRPRPLKGFTPGAIPVTTFSRIKPVRSD